MNNISRLSNHISEYSYLRPRVFPTFCFQCHDFMKNQNNNKPAVGQVNCWPVTIVPAIYCTSYTAHLCYYPQLRLCSMYIMAIWVVELSNGKYKIRKICSGELFGTFFFDLSQREKHFEIRPPLL